MQSLCVDVKSLVSPVEIIDYSKPKVDISRFQTYRRSNHPDPTLRGSLEQVLFQIIISQRTTITSEVQAASQLFKAYPTLTDLAAADTRAIASQIAPAGLQEAKAARISSIARLIARSHGDGWEAYMRGLEDAAARAVLLALPGVGPKTADCLLELGLQRLVLPIDTNIRRVGLRLGWMLMGESDEQLQGFIVDVLPKNNDAFIESHSVLMAIGQSMCRSSGRRAQCLICGHLEERANLA